MSLPLPNDAQVDALREVANIGCGHAANALSRLMGGRQVDLSIPRVQLGGADVGALLGPDAQVVSASLGIRGELHGTLLLVLPRADAGALESLLLGSQSVDQAERDSVVAEVANIAASACLSALGRLTGWKLMPTVPTLRRGGTGGALALATADMAHGVVLEARFQAATVPPVGGQLLLLLERDSARTLLARLGV
ncbi:chemotaxis protein CheC [Pyxidicoccus trucidator]|uniref:chemotaxis protein CheC n=1 Tax=Pyxidicoccus trucidator TaxID=2709662 RepID=UPI0013D8F8CF|nr:chemotaxis protein CheC [Pyxidicoccus trucidator]